MSQHTFKWTTQLFFHLLDLKVPNSWILLPSYGDKYTDMVRKLFEAVKSQDHPTPRLVARPSTDTTNTVQLKSRHNQHWPAKPSTILSLFILRPEKGYNAQGQTCDVGLCMVHCFMEYHSAPNCQLNFQVVMAGFTNLQKCRGHVKIVHTRRVEHTEFLTEDPKTFGVNIENLVAWATWNPKFVCLWVKEPPSLQSLSCIQWFTEIRTRYWCDVSWYFLDTHDTNCSEPGYKPWCHNGRTA
jgi:hypothetical protein